MFLVRRVGRGGSFELQQQQPGAGAQFMLPYPQPNSSRVPVPAGANGGGPSARPAARQPVAGGRAGAPGAAHDVCDVGRLYAMKVLKKASLIRSRKDVQHTKTERDILQRIRVCVDCPLSISIVRYYRHTCTCNIQYLY